LPLRGAEAILGLSVLGSRASRISSLPKPSRTRSDPDPRPRRDIHRVRRLESPVAPDAAWSLGLGTWGAPIGVSHAFAARSGGAQAPLLVELAGRYGPAARKIPPNMQIGVE